MFVILFFQDDSGDREFSLCDMLMGEGPNVEDTSMHLLHYLTYQSAVDEEHDQVPLKLCSARNKIS